MITSLPKVLRYPNYSYRVMFVDKLEDDDDSTAQACPIDNESDVLESIKSMLTSPEKSSKGILYPATCTVKIKKSFDALNKHHCCTFIAATILNNCSIELTDPEIVILGHSIYSLLERNNLRSIAEALFSDELGSRQFTIRILGFDVKVKQHNREELGIGLFVVNQMYILMLRSVNAKLKFVVLIHELIELISTLFNLRLKHSEIQSIAENLAYLITHNNFTT
jgi:hypothetical protein